MKKGLIAALDHIDGRPAAALLRDGKLIDLLIDPPAGAVQPEAIYRARTGQQMKGQNGLILDMGKGAKGFLKGAKGIAQGTVLLVQAATHAEPHKATPVVPKIIFKSRYCIITPTAPGINIARRIKDDDLREELLEIVHETLQGDAADFGVIIRSAAMGAPAEDIGEDIAETTATAMAVMAQQSGTPELLLPAPNAHARAWRDWIDPEPSDIETDAGCFEYLGILDQIDMLQTPHVRLPNGASMEIEPTSALVAIDVNTGADFSLGAGLKANLAAAKELPKQLSLRGLGGQIVIDFAPSPKKDRRQIETALQSALRRDGVDTILVGWTNLGNFELQRKRERLPLSELLS
ncbi:ribonuclease G [Amylibacter marinus]|uniref:Ribonuclease G n=1 Tax=Amylibacter marinus TaxID=1475483 RepID=A0ABQ5VXH6_9RHOB|nr:ribonuclease E/G [Amylibacter marinus]GLQ36136.1 ribonuclease G [Amylibacter marinus]